MIRGNLIDDGPPILTRSLIESGTLAAMATANPGRHPVLTRIERARSMREALDSRPPGPAWIFAYGSLIWNPVMRYDETRVVTVEGWHRSFCLSAENGRGTPEQPGLVLGLDSGGRCTGLAFRVPEHAVEEEFTLLWEREMISGSYVPTWLPAAGPDGDLHALAFSISRDCRSYEGAIPACERVRRIASARGCLGSSADYLFRTRDALKALGIYDLDIEELAGLVAAEREISANPSGE